MRTLLTIIIPVYNEEATVKKIINGVIKVKLPRGVNREVVVIDDASSDKTPKILKKIKGIRIFRHKVNQGKGAAMRTGISKAKGDILLMQDADLEYDPKYIPILIEPIRSGMTKVVYGTRLKDYPLRLTGAKRTPLITHYIGNKFLSLVTSVLFASAVTDMETGYKVFHKSAIKGLKFQGKRFELEPEITAKVLKRGHKIYEIPIKTVPRGYDEGKKITWRDGFGALKALIKYRLRD